jgi:hypothetical protein
VLESTWYSDRGSPAASDPEPSPPEVRAAWMAARHAGTPTQGHLDTLGRSFLSVAHNRTDGVEELYRTRTKLDIEGNSLAIFDARQIRLHEQDPFSSLRSTVAQTFDVLQRAFKTISADAGTQLTVADVTGKPLRSWDSRGQTHRQRFDALQRPTHVYVQKGSSERLVLRTVYGEALDPAGLPPTNPASASPAQQANLRGKPVHVYDCAGLVTSIAHDFKGNLLSASRRLAVAYQTEPDWIAAENLTDPAAILGSVASLLQSEVFTTSSTFDALNRVTTATAPDASPPGAPVTAAASVTRPVYNEANLLESVHVSVRGATETPVITDLDYNARGQRTLCQYQNGTVTTYQYDAKTFRLVELLTVRGSTKLQHVLYTYDPVGNITDIQDLSNWDSVLNALTSSGITGSGRYHYDALYRLLSASGREHPGPQPDGRSDTEPPRWNVPHGSDLQALQSYREELAYDEVGNIVEMRHLSGPSNSASWSRRYDYFPENNRLRATSIPGDAADAFSATYGYQEDASNDAGRHGSMTRMPHLAAMEWDYADRLKHTVKSVGSGQDTYFVYDSAGQRVRKVYAHDGVVEERVYLGTYEIYRRHTATVTSTPEEERQTLHVMDDQRRVAMVETKTRDAGVTVPSPVSRWRFQLDNHLGSATLELDQASEVISYEEYHPTGQRRSTPPTAPRRSARSDTDIPAILESVHVSVRGTAETPVITNLDYNARGQRTLCQYQSGTVTSYQYDPNTFRLTELITLRGATKLQHLLYTYDPVGNITDIQDLSNWDSVLNALTAAGITGSGKYRYDALYRLLSATGREHPGPQPDGSADTEPPRWAIPHGNDLQALQSYREELTYDEVGNILEMRHLRGLSNSASWFRRYRYADESNRLLRTSIPGDPAGTFSSTYGYADNDGGLYGSMTRMPHLASMEWDYAVRLKHALKSNGSAEDTYFTYASSSTTISDGPSAIGCSWATRSTASERATRAHSSTF